MQICGNGDLQFWKQKFRVKNDVNWAVETNRSQAEGKLEGLKLQLFL